ncbi:DUF2147 domain-containing protein [Paracoccaceae bacterium GXU_MW_L88]
MKKLLLAAALALPGAAFAQDVSGIWQTGTSDEGAYLHVQIAPCAGATDQICGVITKTFNSDNDVSGKNIISNMKSDGGGNYSGGTIWAPDQDKRYGSKMTLSGNSLKVSGCVAGGIICRSQTWSRVQ